jgi:hypothetical protein
MEIDPPWELNTATSIRLPNGLRLEGTRYRTPLPDGKVLEVFRGIERRLHGLLAAGEIGRYLRAAPALYTRWAPASRDLADGVLSIGRDGTALVLRVTSQRG